MDYYYLYFFKLCVDSQQLSVLNQHMSLLHQLKAAKYPLTMTLSLHRCLINHRGKVLGLEPIWDYNVQIYASSSQTKTKTHIWKDSVAFPFLIAMWAIFTIHTPTTATSLSIAIISFADILGLGHIKLKEGKENLGGTYFDSFYLSTSYVAGMMQFCIRYVI